MSERRPDTDAIPPDPSGIEEPHDVLAAEEFAMPTRRSDVPPDPSGIQEPHDVLAAEEFAMPTGDGDAAATQGGFDPRAWIPAALAAVVGALVALAIARRVSRVR